MRFISWNVNGLRAVLKKGFEDIFLALDADFFCLQETKLQEGQVSLDLPGYESLLCRQKGLLRYRSFHKAHAHKRHPKPRHRRA